MKDLTEAFAAWCLPLVCCRSNCGRTERRVEQKPAQAGFMCVFHIEYPSDYF